MRLVNNTGLRWLCGSENKYFSHTQDVRLHVSQGQHQSMVGLGTIGDPRLAKGHYPSGMICTLHGAPKIKVFMTGLLVCTGYF